MTNAHSAPVEQQDSPQEGGLLAQILARTRIVPSQEGYAVAERGVAAFIAEMLKSSDRQQPVNRQLVDQMLAQIDARIGKQMDIVLHNPRFQALESSWRGLKFLVDRTDFRENTLIDLLHVTKTELLEDFESASDITRSGLYRHVYTAGYGQFGGSPVGCMVSNYTFGPSAPDIKLLGYVASVGAMAHAPFLGAAGPEMFNLESFQGLANLKEVKDIFDGPRFAKWRALRDSEDARYLGLSMPRFLLREPYDPLENPARSFDYRETIDGNHDHYLWGNTSFALASRIVDSFAKYRWCPNIIGPQSGGTVDDLPVHLYESLGQIQAKIPTEVLVSDRREFELSSEGFIPLSGAEVRQGLWAASAEAWQLRLPVLLPGRSHADPSLPGHHGCTFRTALVERGGLQRRGTGTARTSRYCGLDPVSPGSGSQCCADGLRADERHPSHPCHLVEDRAGHQWAAAVSGNRGEAGGRGGAEECLRHRGVGDKHAEKSYNEGGKKQEIYEALQRQRALVDVTGAREFAALYEKEVKTFNEAITRSGTEAAVWARLMNKSGLVGKALELFDLSCAQNASDYEQAVLNCLAVSTYTDAGLAALTEQIETNPQDSPLYLERQRLQAAD